MATSVAKIQAELDLDTGRFTGSVTSAIGSVKKFNSTVGDADKSLKNIEHRVTGLGASLRDTMVILGQFRGAMHTLWTFTGQWVGAIVEANSKLERLQVLMKGLSKSTTEVGKVTDSLRDMNYVLEKSKQTPFAIDTIADAFVKLKASGIDPTKGSLDALTDATARFGGNSETLHRATIAIQQMAGKGVISMEELRQQLGEAVPNAMQLMAQAVGMSMATLVKTISTGRLQASGALDKLFLEMRIQFAGSSDNMMNTWSGLVQKLKTEWLLFAKQIGDAGLFAGAKQSLRDLIAFMGSAQGKALANDIGKSIGEAAKMAADLIHWLVDNRDEIITWGKLLAEIFILKRVTDFGIGLVKTGAEIVNWTRTLGGLSTAMAAARAGTISWTAAIGAAAGPIGLAITAIGSLVMWLNNQYQASIRAGNAMLNYYEITSRGGIVSPEEQKGMADRIDYLNRVNKAVQEAEGHDVARSGAARERVDNKLDSLLAEGRTKGFVQDAGNALSDAFTGLHAKADFLAKMYTANIKTAVVNYGKQAALQSADEANKVVTAYGENMRKKGETIMSGIASSLNGISEKLNSGKLTPEQATAERTKVLGGAINQRIAQLQAARQTLADQYVNLQYDEEKAQNVKKLMDETDKLLGEAMNDRQTALSSLVLLPKMGNGKEGGGKGKANPLAEYLQTVIGKVAELKAKVEDGEPALAKFQALLAAGEFGKNPDQSLVAKVTAQLKLLGEEQDKKKIKALAEDIKEMEAASASDLMLSKLESTNKMYAEVSTSMVSFNRKIAVMREEWIKAHHSVEGFNESIAQTKQNMADLDFQSLTRFVEDAEWQAYLDGLPKRARDLAEYTHQLAMNKGMIDQMKLGNPGKASELDQLGARNADAITKQYQNATKPAWQSLLDDWNDVTTQMDNMWSNSMKSISDSLVDACVTGKMNFRDLATNILKEITRILISKAVAKLVDLIMNVFGAAAGSSGGNTTSYGGTAGNSYGTGHNGSLIGSAKGNAFTDGHLMKFGKGGAFTNKLTTGTNLAPMSMFGEAGPEAIMPLSRDQSGALGVKVSGDMAGGGGTITNQVSVQVTIENDGKSSSKSDSDGEQGRALGNLIGNKVKEAMVEELRPGGILWKMRNG